MTGTAQQEQARTALRQVLTRAPFGNEVSVEEVCGIATSVGAVGIDAINDPADWPILERHGLVCSLMRVDYGGGVSTFFPPRAPAGWDEIASKEAQGEFVWACLDAIGLAADHGIANIALHCGSRGDMSFQQGADNAVAFLGRLKDKAEARGVTLNVENMNSVGQFAPPGSIFDHMAWGLDVVRRVNSPNVKILFDIFHAQVMDGNIVDTLRTSLPWIGHIHAAGVPGKGPLDDTQELNFGFIGRALVDAGYRGFVAHEWNASPDLDAMAALRRSVTILAGGE